MNDKLSESLKTWSPEPVTGMDIRAGVWHRIERTEPSRWQSVIDSIVIPLTRPALVSGLVALAIIAGVAVGTISSATAQKQAYLNSVAMFRMTP